MEALTIKEAFQRYHNGIKDRLNKSVKLYDQPDTTESEKQSRERTSVYTIPIPLSAACLQKITMFRP